MTTPSPEGKQNPVRCFSESKRKIKKNSLTLVHTIVAHISHWIKSETKSRLYLWPIVDRPITKTLSSSLSRRMCYTYAESNNEPLQSRECDCEIETNQRHKTDWQERNAHGHTKVSRLERDESKEARKKGDDASQCSAAAKLIRPKYCAVISDDNQLIRFVTWISVCQKEENRNIDSRTMSRVWS